MLGKITTPEELGEMLRKGEITRGQATEIMARRAELRRNEKRKTVSEDRPIVLEAGAPVRPSNDLIIEPWDGGGTAAKRGGSREVWEYASEKSAPERGLILMVAGVVILCLAAMCIIFWKVLWFFN